MKKIIFLFLAMACLVFGETNSAQTQIELRVNILPLSMLIVEVDPIDFGNVNKGAKIEKSTTVRVYGRKDLDVNIAMEKEANLSKKEDFSKKLTAVFLNHEDVTGRPHKLNQNISGEEAELHVDIHYEMTVPASADSGEYLGATIVRVIVDN